MGKIRSTKATCFSSSDQACVCLPLRRPEAPPNSFPAAAPLSKWPDGSSRSEMYLRTSTQQPGVLVLGHHSWCGGIRERYLAALYWLCWNPSMEQELFYAVLDFALPGGHGALLFDGHFPHPLDMWDSMGSPSRPCCFNSASPSAEID